MEGIQAGRVASKAVMSSSWPQGDADVVEALEEALAGGVVEREVDLDADAGTATRAALDVDGDLERRVGLDGPQQLLADLGRHPHRHEAVLGGSCCGRCRRSGGEITAWKP